MKDSEAGRAVKQMGDDKSGREAGSIDHAAPSAPVEVHDDESPATPAAHESSSTPEPLREVEQGVEDTVLHHVDRHFVKTEAIGWWVATTIIALVDGIPLAVLSILHVGPVWLRLLLLGIWGIILLLLIYLSRHVPVWTYERTRYRVTSEGIEIRKGIVWRQVINVSRNRVQHTDVTQGPIQRHYGLATLTIHTAGTTHSVVTLSGVSRETALRLRDFLICRESMRHD